MLDQRTRIEFNGKLYTQKHGNAFDRGSADSWYSRPRDPHKYPSGTGKGLRVVLQPGTAEYKNYMAGYDYNEQFGGKKDYD